MSEQPEVRCSQVIPTLGVGDVAAAIDWYVASLGFTEAWRWGDPPVHAGLTFGDTEIHVSQSEPNPGGSWLYFVVTDVDELYDRFVAQGVEIGHPPQDQEWGMRELPVVDLVGNPLTFAAPTIVREPKLPIEREEVTVRLEKRLLALLGDLAERKGFDLTELLEETLLHTFEPVSGDGVASPHTPGDLARIAELKKEHGIDYDVHASYRFVEADGDEG